MRSATSPRTAPVAALGPSAERVPGGSGHSAGRRLAEAAYGTTNDRARAMALRERLAVVRRLRALLAERGHELAGLVDAPLAEVLAGQLIPLANACRFLEARATVILAPRQEDHLEIRREPLGTVLVIGPSNYPLFLPAVQALQAFVAGNVVLLKPGRGGQRVLRRWLDLWREAGLPADAVRLLDESVESAQVAIAAGVDKVFFTGAAANGEDVARRCAEHLTPVTLELSGDDPVIIRADADLKLVDRALTFGRTFNHGNTCIAPRRVLVHRHLADRVVGYPFESDAEAVRLANASEYALGATIFTRDHRAARSIAGQLNAGVVVINDMIAPTADPRVPFGGRGRSGFGVTRGAEGLLEMTTVKTIIHPAGRWKPHLSGARDADAPLLAALLRWRHSDRLTQRLRALRQLIQSITQRRTSI